MRMPFTQWLVVVEDELKTKVTPDRWRPYYDAELTALEAIEAVVLGIVPV